MQAERRIELRAIDRGRNVFRVWSCEVCTDLFGVTVARVRFGRTGSVGRVVEHVVGDEAGALRLVRGLLGRRATAERRIGVAYRVVVNEGFELGRHGAVLAPAGPAT